MDNLNEIKETLKDMFKAAITNAKDGDEKGEWITINGTHVFIPKGKTAEDVIKEKGWKEKGEGKEKSETKKDDDYKREADIALTMMAQDYEKRGNKGTADRANEIKEKLKKGEELTEKDKADIKTALDTYKPKDNPPEGKKESKQPENWDERKDKKKIEKKLTDIAKKRFDTIETLETQHSDSKDFHDLAVWGIKDVLTEAYQEGAGNKNKVSEKILTDIAKKEMDIPTLKERHSDSDDFHDVSVWSLKEALKKAFLAGEKNKSDNSIKNGLSEIIKNCKPETKEDLKVLKGLKDILEEQ